MTRTNKKQALAKKSKDMVKDALCPMPSKLEPFPAAKPPNPSASFGNPNSAGCANSVEMRETLVSGGKIQHSPLHWVLCSDTLKITLVVSETKGTQKHSVGEAPQPLGTKQPKTETPSATMFSCIPLVKPTALGTHPNTNKRL